jgi:hypothetical protein
MWQNVAFALIGLGIIVLIGWSVQGFFANSEIPIAIRITTGAVTVGVLILIGIVVKDRIAKAKTENFKGVEN